MQFYLKHLRIFCTVHKTKLMGGILILALVSFGISFMLSMPRTFFAALGFCAGILTYHYWDKIITNVVGLSATEPANQAPKN